MYYTLQRIYKANKSIDTLDKAILKGWITETDKNNIVDNTN